MSDVGRAMSGSKNTSAERTVAAQSDLGKKDGKTKFKGMSVETLNKRSPNTDISYVTNSDKYINTLYQKMDTLTEGVRFSKAQQSVRSKGEKYFREINISSSTLNSNASVISKTEKLQEEFADDTINYNIENLINWFTDRKKYLAMARHLAEIDVDEVLKSATPIKERIKKINEQLVDLISIKKIIANELRGRNNNFSKLIMQYMSVGEKETVDEFLEKNIAELNLIICDLQEKEIKHNNDFCEMYEKLEELTAEHDKLVQKLSASEEGKRVLKQNSDIRKFDDLYSDISTLREQARDQSAGDKLAPEKLSLLKNYMLENESIFKRSVNYLSEYTNNTEIKIQKVSNAIERASNVLNEANKNVEKLKKEEHKYNNSEIFEAARRIAEIDLKGMQFNMSEIYRVIEILRDRIKNIKNWMPREEQGQTTNLADGRNASTNTRPEETLEGKVEGLERRWEATLATTAKIHEDLQQLLTARNIVAPTTV